MAKQRQKARAGMSVSDDDMATYTAARAFLFGEWVGALIMVASFTQLYIVTFVAGGNAGWSIGIGLAALALGGWVFWSNRTYYLRLNFPWRRKWDAVAVVFALAGVVFWLLFGLLAALVWNGVPVQP